MTCFLQPILTHWNKMTILQGGLSRHGMKKTRARYQQGNIRKVPRASGFAWEARFANGKVDGKQKYKSYYFDGAQYPTEASVRTALQHKVVLTNSAAGRAKVDARFQDIIEIYRAKHLPNLEHSTQQTNSYLIDSYIEPEFGERKITEITPLAVLDWFDSLNLAGTTKSSIRSVLSVSLRLAAIHGYIPISDARAMSLVTIKGVSKRQKKKKQITMDWFHRLIKALPEPLNIMVIVDGCLGLRISELVALKWEDVDPKIRTIMIQRKFTHGKLGKTKTDASEAGLPLGKELFEILDYWKPKANGSEWVFPSNRTGGVRSASMLLQKGIQPVAKQIGLGHITWHMLRHACRSWLDSIRTPTGVQKDLLRVADISTAMNIYGHALTDDMRKSHNKLVKQLIPAGLLTDK
ncbi:MAG: tyrosine-type recombinase/integrase [Terracidiphilus sp.]